MGSEFNIFPQNTVFNPNLIDLISTNYGFGSGLFLGAIFALRLQYLFGPPLKPRTLNLKLLKKTLNS